MEGIKKDILNNWIDWNYNKLDKNELIKLANHYQKDQNFWNGYAKSTLRAETISNWINWNHKSLDRTQLIRIIQYFEK